MKHNGNSENPKIIGLEVPLYELPDGNLSGIRPVLKGTSIVPYRCIGDAFHDEIFAFEVDASFDCSGAPHIHTGDILFVCTNVDAFRLITEDVYFLTDNRRILPFARTRLFFGDIPRVTIFGKVFYLQRMFETEETP